MLLEQSKYKHTEKATSFAFLILTSFQSQTFAGMCLASYVVFTMMLYVHVLRFSELTASLEGGATQTSSMLATQQFTLHVQSAIT